LRPASTGAKLIEARSGIFSFAEDCAAAGGAEAATPAHSAATVLVRSLPGAARSRLPRVAKFDIAASGSRPMYRLGREAAQGNRGVFHPA
jgi:hypothetical protein